MPDEELDQLRKLRFQRSRIPVLDALCVFVPDDSEDEFAQGIAERIAERTSFSRWYPEKGGHRVLIPYEGGPYDADLYSIEKGGWDHEHCRRCRVNIPAMTLCWVTESGAYVILCDECHTKTFGPNDV